MRKQLPQLLSSKPLQRGNRVPLSTLELHAPSTKPVSLSAHTHQSQLWGPWRRIDPGTAEYISSDGQLKFYYMSFLLNATFEFKFDQKKISLILYLSCSHCLAIEIGCGQTAFLYIFGHDNSQMMPLARDQQAGAAKP